MTPYTGPQKSVAKVGSGQNTVTKSHSDFLCRTLETIYVETDREDAVERSGNRGTGKTHFLT